MRNSLLKAVALSAVCSQAVAATALNGPYATLFGGYSYMPNNVETAQFINSHYRSGYDAGFSFGYKSGPFTYDVQGTYLAADIKRFDFDNTTQTTISGSTYALALMLDGYYSLEDFHSVLVPFVGLGIGYTYRNTNIHSTTPDNSRLKDNEYLFGYQGTLGLTYNFSENVAFDAHYRYLTTAKGDNFGKRLQAHMANISVIYRYDS
jgi:opacity protein-like surface antigen